MIIVKNILVHITVLPVVENFVMKKNVLKNMIMFVIMEKKVKKMLLRTSWVPLFIEVLKISCLISSIFFLLYYLIGKPGRIDKITLIIYFLVSIIIAELYLILFS